MNKFLLWGGVLRSGILRSGILELISWIVSVFSKQLKGLSLNEVIRSVLCGSCVICG